LTGTADVGNFAASVFLKVYLMTQNCIEQILLGLWAGTADVRPLVVPAGKKRMQPDFTAYVKEKTP